MGYPEKFPFQRGGVQVRMAAEVPLAVVVTSYSGRRSQMLLWDTERDVFHIGHWVKGRMSLLDVSADGRYAAYFVEAFRRPVPSYIAVSRPPFLTALFFQPVLHVNWYSGHFTADREFEWFGRPLTEDLWQGRAEFATPRIVPGCPLRVRTTAEFTYTQTIRRREAERPSVKAAVERYGPAAARLIEDAAQGIGLVGPADPYLAMPGATATWDHRGRLIVTHEWSRLLAFTPGESAPVELLDITKAVWSNVATPDWARAW